MLFELGDFLWHREYGVGQVQRILPGDPIEYEIQIKEQRPIRMTGQFLLQGFQKLTHSGFHALAYQHPEEARQLIQVNPVEVIFLALQDFPIKKAKTIDLKEYLEIYVDRDWADWWKKTQLLLKDDPRVDTTHSLKQEYALAGADRTPTHESYLAFDHARRTTAPAGQLVERALSALERHRKGPALSQEYFDELLDYLRQVIFSERYPIELRLKTLFHLREEKWLTPAELQEDLERLLRQEIRLYQLEPYTRTRLMEILIGSKLDDKGSRVLAGGICADGRTIRALLSWAGKKSRPDFLARMLVTALSENLPPELPETEYTALTARLEACREIGSSLPSNVSSWPEIFTALPGVATRIASNAKSDSVLILIKPLTMLTSVLWGRAATFSPESQVALINGLVGAEYPLPFILSLLETLEKNSLPEEFKQNLIDRLWLGVESRADHLLQPFLEKFWQNPVEQAAGLVHLACSYPQPAMIQRAGNALVKLGVQAAPELRVALIPMLDYFHMLQGEWIWQEPLAGLRESAYYEMLRDFGRQFTAGTYYDQAIAYAAQRWLQNAMQTAREETDDLSAQLVGARKNLSALQAEMEEKHVLLKELRSGLRDERSKIGFEERSRLLKELASSLAEIERYISAQPSANPEVEAVLKRFANLLAVNKVTPLDAIGTRIAFNPQTQRLIDSGDTQPGQAVIVVERGYVVRDSDDRARLLKPAIVRKA